MRMWSWRVHGFKYRDGKVIGSEEVCDLYELGIMRWGLVLTAQMCYFKLLDKVKIPSHQTAPTAVAD